MSTSTATRLDRTRIQELTVREEERLNANTQKSKETFERASHHLSGGVASSYQLRDPWPIYMESGVGPKVWDVDGNEMWDFHNGFGSMVQGHANPIIGEAVPSATSRAPTSPHRPRTRSPWATTWLPAGECRSGATPTPVPKRRWTRSGSPAVTPDVTT